MCTWISFSSFTCSFRTMSRFVSWFTFRYTLSSCLSFLQWLMLHQNFVVVETKKKKSTWTKFHLSFRVSRCYFHSFASFCISAFSFHIVCRLSYPATTKFFVNENENGKWNVYTQNENVRGFVEFIWRELKNWNGTLIHEKENLKLFSPLKVFSPCV